MLQSFQKNYELTLAAEGWRSTNKAENFWSLTPGLSSTVSGSKFMDWSDRVAIPSKKLTIGTLTSDELSSLQDLYAAVDKDYDKLRDKYRQSIGQRRGKKTSLAQLPTEWTPKTKKVALSDQEKLYLQMTPTINCAKSATINKYKFRTSQSQLNLKTDNSAIKGWYIEQDSDVESTPIYGFIKRIFIHENYPNG